MDITERKQAEELRQSEARFRAIIDQAVAGMAETDLRGTFTFVNQQFCKITGYERQELLGMRLHDITHPNDRARNSELFARLIAHHTPFQIEKRYVRKDGSDIWVSNNLGLIRDAAGNPQSVLAVTHPITERKWAEEELRQSEARYRTLFDSIDEGFCTIDVLFDRDHKPIDYRFREVNLAFEKMTGLRDAAGKTARELVPNFEPFWFETYGHVALTGEAVRFEHRSESMKRWFDVYASRVGAQTSRNVAIVLTDITERKQMETVLRESEARFRNMADNAPVMVWVTDVAGQCTYLSTSWYAFTAQTPETSLGFGWLQPVHPDDQQAAHDIFIAANEKCEAFRIEYRIRRHDGAYRWAIDSAVPRWGDTGEFLGYIGSVIDIQERKQAEEHLRALLAKGADMITVSDRDGTILYASPSTERVSGYTAAEFMGSNPFMESIHPDDVARCRDAMDRLFATPGLSLTLEHRARHKSGAWHWYEGTFTSLFHDPAVGGLVANVRNITERKAAAEEVARLYAAEQAARVEMEAALHTRDQFLSIASHELRTPLTSLMGYASLLPKAAARGTRDVAQMTERINRQAQRLNGLIEQLLDVSRLQRGQFMIERRAVDFAALVAEVVTEVRAALPPYAAHTIDLIRPNEPMVVVGDAQRLEEVLQNLLNNAVKYSPQGGPVHVRLERTEMEAVVEIADQGIGIPSEAQAHLFEPFYRASNVGAQTSGFGLGLHIVQEIVQRHGGRITLQSTEGEGSAFCVVLPLRLDEDGHQQDAASAPL